MPKTNNFIENQLKIGQKALKIVGEFPAGTIIEMRDLTRIDLLEAREVVGSSPV